jgi:FAD/FMN-containing dehydrogenase
MTDLITRTFYRLGKKLAGKLSLPGDEAYGAATAIWAKPTGALPRAIAHCETAADVQSAIRAARDCHLPLSVRGGGHDWASRALCEGLVIDLRGMNAVTLRPDRTARVAGGARAADLVTAADPHGLAAVTGSVGAVGMAGLTLGGGYGPLIGRFGLALDNLLDAEIVLADGRILAAGPDNEAELFWALRGGGGNFGVVTAMRHKLHELPSVRFGILIYSAAEARSVLQGCAEIAASAPEELTVQVGFAGSPDGATLIFVAPTWSGRPEEGEARTAPFTRLGSLLAGGLEASPYGKTLSAFDPFLVNGQRVIMDSCWLPALDSGAIEIFLRAMEAAVSPGCALITHEFKGAASRVPAEATAFGLRRDHLVIEILACFGDEAGADAHRQWVRNTRQAFQALALPGAYPNFLAPGDGRAAQSYGNAERLIAAKRHYDPDNLFRSAIPLPADRAIRKSAVPIG